MRIQDIREIYSEFSATYEIDVKGKMRYTAYLKLPRAVMKHLDSRASRILDLGCGTGLSSLLFLKAGHKVTGIDGSRAMLELAGRLPFQRLICQNLEKRLRVKDHSFDAAVMIGIMEYIENPAALLEEVKRKLKPGGVFGLTFPQRSSWYTEDGLRSYYKKDIEPMMVETGFRVLECERILGVKEYETRNGMRTYYWNYVLKT